MSDGTLHIAEVAYPSGAIRCRYAFILSPDDSRRLRHGRYVEYHDGGAEGTYVNDLEHGEWRDYYANGQLAAVGLYVNGKEEGVWKFWNEDGHPEPETIYSTGIEQPAKP